MSLRNEVRNSTLAQRVKKAQPFCSRCSSRRSLHAHHKHMWADGGADIAENLDVLCKDCHVEWHEHFEGRTTYEVFLTTVPSRDASVVLTMAAEWGVAADDAVAIYWRAKRSFRHAPTYDFWVNGENRLAQCATLEGLETLRAEATAAGALTLAML